MGADFGESVLMANTEDRYKRFYMLCTLNGRVEIFCNFCDATLLHVGGGSMGWIVQTLDRHLDTCEGK